MSGHAAADGNGPPGGLNQESAPERAAPDDASGITWSQPQWVQLPGQFLAALISEDDEPLANQGVCERHDRSFCIAGGCENLARVVLRTNPAAYFDCNPDDS